MSQTHQVLAVSIAGLTLCALIIVGILAAHFAEARRVIAAAPLPVEPDCDLWAADLEWAD